MGDVVRGVSVIVPCFNAGAYLDAALDSILGQTIPPVKVIVIDDGSTDDSAERAERRGPSVLCVRQPNCGIAVARNRGIDHAASDLIAFLDADDIWPADSIARRLAVLDSDPDAVCVFGATEQFGDVRRLEPARTGRLISAMLARRWVFERIGAFDPALRVGETLDWAARLDDSGLGVRYIDDIVLRRRIHANNTVRDREKYIDYVRALRASLNRRRARETPA